jgi:hypothetical protein
MKPKYLSLIIASLVLCTVACKKSGLNGTSPNASVDVYIAGYVTYGPGKNLGAAYWKNGAITKLTDSLTFADARGIAVQGNDVYVVGTLSSADLSAYHAVYWKNGVATTLSSPSNSQAWAIAFRGTDMYVVGSAYNTTLNTPQATCWKNGVATTLTGGILANAIAVNGTDIYVAGSAGTPGNLVAAWWKNGVATTLTGGFEATAITVNGTDVYVAGTMNNGTAVYWKNGVATLLTNDAVANNIGYSVCGIAANGADVFVTGGALYNDGTNPLLNNGNGIVATVWKNNVAAILSIPTTVPADPLNNIATAVCLNGADVYMTSQVINNGTGQYASYYWKNGVPVQLSNGGTKGFFANSIVVVPQ